MFGSFIVYSGLAAMSAGLAAAIRARGAGRRSVRRRALRLAGSGALLTSAALGTPVCTSRLMHASTRLDEIMPEWQFHEKHSITVDAPPGRIFAAIKQVTADDIRFFRMLTRIRRGGRRLPPCILNPTKEPIVEVALRGGFLRLAELPERELVIGTVVIAPGIARRPWTPAIFDRPVPPGFAVAAMNFLVTPGGGDRWVVSTETRIFASGASTRRRFAVYWRLIHPGSALLRRTWLRAIARRAALNEFSDPAVLS